MMASEIYDTHNGRLLYRSETDPFQGISARFSPDGKKILTVGSWDYDSVKIWNAENGQLKKAIYFSGALYDVDWQNERIMIHNNSKLVCFNIVTGEELYSFIAIDSTDYIVLTPDKYYMCSKNAANKLSWLVGDKLYSFDQFDLQYNRPDIVHERLGNPDVQEGI
jgi:WD40 repeat protein